MNQPTKFLSLLFLGACLTVSAFAHKGKSGFAIVVDSATYENVNKEIKQYAKSIEEKDHLTTYIIVDKWGNPDSIRTHLYSLYQQKESPIEGAVLIGDIPIAMIRDAQHLTSAFKMDQIAFDKKESSVPSDRFYDDFGLKFRFLEKDKNERLYFYYSLAPESSQKLNPAIYSGRIKANDENGTSRYQKIADFLKKAVQQKYGENTVDQLLYFSGNGYVSESLLARIDEKEEILENFPWLKKQQNGIEYIDHARDTAIKYRLMTEMQRSDLDLAILHHHGDVEIEYMNNVPKVDNPTDEQKYLQMYLRESLRYGKEKGRNVDSLQTVLAKRFDNLPAEWFKGAFDQKVIEQDSLFTRSLDLYIEDFDHYSPNAKMVILDACFNGSFHKNKYIAGAYIFGGQTVAVMANSVNVLQDKWHDRYVGLLALGMRAGRMTQMNPYLEGHLIGDPTFHFAAQEQAFDVNEALLNKKESFWKKQLKSTSPAIRTLALRELVYNNKKDYSGLLLNQFQHSTSYIERMEILVLLSTYNNDNFIQCLQAAVNDSYELVQRFALNFIAQSGDPRLASALISIAIRNNTSERSEFNTKMALALFPEDVLINEFEKQFSKITYYSDKQKVHDQIAKAIKLNANKWTKEIRPVLQDSIISEKSKLSTIRYLRNYHLHALVPEILNYLQNTTDEKQQVALLEALGWFNLSYRKDEIATVALKISNDSKYAKITRDEALKTYNRLTGSIN